LNLKDVIEKTSKWSRRQVTKMAEKCECGHDRDMHWNGSDNLGNDGSCMCERKFKNGKKKWCACKGFKHKEESN